MDMKTITKKKLFRLLFIEPKQKQRSIFVILSISAIQAKVNTNNNVAWKKGESETRKNESSPITSR